MGKQDVVQGRVQKPRSAAATRNRGKLPPSAAASCSPELVALIGAETPQTVAERDSGGAIEPDLPAARPLALVFAAAVRQALFPAPLRPPADASSAALCCGRLGDLYSVLDAGPHGRGLFLRDRGAAAGAFISRYSGELRNARTLPLPSELPRTHMLRVKGSDDILDGLPLAQRLVRARGGEWVPADAADACEGYGSLANSAPKAKANARIVFLPDDSAWRREYAAKHEGGAAPASLPRCLAGMLPKAAYLVATRTLQPLEQVCWSYKYVHNAD